ncbi:MAG TPA: bifunctional glutamate N-acetyltransferase/amino-acid acetyltransferase ArgJ [Candidatus Hydrogenedentes bacterium]|jgi:glutamate N-acetyltransferase/amino-acid N-acetyltransferase|nr:bifunctional glutamate N-acetyltransferase/amino-acid acetyltransferase ArgJ [Candidatus Hydrogenedentota bacterium]HPK00012.1 bifunctional glutamate N-acetyltransferase/amino-acid acetyltransferase ArgJ [Candidatus Hydrogenedentota bacterium]
MSALEGGITAPKGFRASGVAAGIRRNSSKNDCALVVSDRAASVAGMFTTNVMKAPPVEWNVGVCAKGAARAVFVNSGNANAATGERGHRDARAMADAVAAHLGAPADEVCICSTGVIGVPLPMDRVLDGITRCAASLSVEGHGDAARAIMTTDTVPKELACEVQLSAGTVRIGAMAKGSGMICPNMATMIAVLSTDATVEAPVLSEMLRDAVERSFNCISVDNDMSTSDTVLCLANGAAGLPAIAQGSPDYAAFHAALSGICQSLAKMLVKDGEGATKLVEIAVSGAGSDSEAKTLARSIGLSQLCKTAFFGGDPNWGRIVCAAGYAGVPFDPADVALWLDEVHVVSGGMPLAYREEDAAAVMRRPEFQIRLEVGNGPGSAVFWCSDLSYDYVKINADYRT